MLNEIRPMTTMDHDSRGTALMVVRSLCETWAIDKNQLADKLEHFSYDGVYASPEERTHGGGSLNLTRHVEEV